MLDGFRGFSQGKRPNRATPVRNSESTYLNHSKTASFASGSPGPSCYKDGLFSDFGDLGNFQNHKKLESGANFEGFGASREPLDLPSRAACWVLWVGFFYGAKHSLPGSFPAKIGSKNESSQICMAALEFYISNLAESESVNDFITRQELDGVPS